MYCVQIDAVNGGVMADAQLRVRGNVFAAGDVCSYFDEKLGECLPPPPILYLLLRLCRSSS